MHDVDEPVLIVDYDPGWQMHFAAESGRVRSALGGLALEIEPFGSTAVPGLPGKPIVDLLVGVADLARVTPHIPGLLDLGYESFGEIFVRGRIYLRWRRGTPGFNLAVTPRRGEFWTTAIAVREYLRSHPEEVSAYARMKKEVIARGATMFSSYSREKASFTDALRERALAWSAARGSGGRGSG